MDVTIPEEHRKAFARISEIEEGLFKLITEALELEAPCLSIAELRRRVRKAITSILPKEALLADAIVALAATSSRQDFDPEFLNSVVESVSSNEGLVEQPKSQLRLRLEALLRLPFVHVSAKSSNLQIAHDRVFNAAKVITDIRPVFKDVIESGWVYMVIHHLQITCVRGGSLDPDVLYISMDDNDLNSLEAAIARARGKAALLRKTLNSGQVSEIDGATE